MDYTNPTNRAYLNSRKVTIPERSNEAAYFVKCATCGEAIDLRLTGDAMHHDEPGHEPLNRVQ